jgi:hypothetical protein
MKQARTAVQRWGWGHLKVAAVRDVIEVLDPLLLHKVAQDVHVAVGARVCREDVVVRDDHNLLRVPHLHHHAARSGLHPHTSAQLTSNSSITGHAETLRDPAVVPPAAGAGSPWPSPQTPS